MGKFLRDVEKGMDDMKRAFIEEPIETVLTYIFTLGGNMPGVKDNPWGGGNAPDNSDNRGNGGGGCRCTCECKCHCG
jgi:hypothetical protein